MNGGVSVRGAMVLAVMLAGCNRPVETHAPVPPVVESWKVEAERLQELIKPGMLQPEVLTLAGEPTEHRTIVAGETQQIWDYEIGPKIFFRVIFDDHDKVTGTSIHAENTLRG